MHHRAAQGVFAGRSFAAAPHRLHQRMTVHHHITPDHHVVNRDTRVLAQQVIGRLRDRDVGHHGGEHLACGVSGFAGL
jgi:hypothetical protein